MSSLEEKRLALPLVQETAQEDENDISIIELIYRLLEKAKYIVLAAVFCALLACIYVFCLATPKYEATSKIYVVNSSSSVVDLSSLQLGTYLASDYQEVFKNMDVHEMVKEKLGLDYELEKLAKMVSIYNPSNTRVLYIKVTSTDPQEAVAIADCYVEVAMEIIPDRMGNKEPKQFENARLPEKPASPKKASTVILAFVLGALIAGIVVVVDFLVDDRITSSEYVEKHLGMPTLGMMPLEKEENKKAMKKQQLKFLHKKSGHSSSHSGSHHSAGKK